MGHHGRVKPQNLVDLEPILGSKVLVSPGFPLVSFDFRVLNVCLRAQDVLPFALFLLVALASGFGQESDLGLKGDGSSSFYGHQMGNTMEKHINLDEPWMERTHYVVQHGRLGNS